MKISRIIKRSPTGAVSCFSTGLLHGSFWGMGAVYAHGIGLSTQNISIFMALAVLGGIVSQWPMGRLSDFIDRRIVLMGLAFALSLGSLALALAGDLTPWMFFALAALYGAASFPLYAISIAHVNDMIEPKDFVPASSALLLIYALGAMLGPLIAGVAMKMLGAPGLFYFSMVIGVILGAFAFNRLHFGATVAADKKEDFVAVPKTSAQAYEMAGLAADADNKSNSPDGDA
jgi:MFS family permease